MEQFWGYWKFYFARLVSAVKRYKPLHYSQKFIFFGFPTPGFFRTKAIRLSPGDQLLVREPEVSGYETAGLAKLNG